jgi:hypothetical protein
MGLAAKLSDAPFRTADHALYFAYAEETRVFCKTSEPIIGSSGGQTPQDSMAQSVFILSLLRRKLPEHLSDALDGYYTVPDGITLEGRKEIALRSLSYRVWEEMGRIPHRWYLCDVAREWSRHNRREHDDAWWAKRLSTTSRTLRNWRKGWGDHIGAGERLDTLLSGARARAGDVMCNAGICG